MTTRDELDKAVATLQAWEAEAAERQEVLSVIGYLSAGEKRKPGYVSYTFKKMPLSALVDMLKASEELPPPDPQRVTHSDGQPWPRRA